MTAMTAASGCVSGGVFGPHPRRLTRLGTIDIFIVESNPVVFKGKPWLLEYIRYFAPDKHYRSNDTGKSYLRSRDRRIHPQVRFTDDERAEIAAAKNINVSDHDFCEYGGKLICSYSWGDQCGHEFLALAEAACTEREFCESYFQ